MLPTVLQSQPASRCAALAYHAICGAFDCAVRLPHRFLRFLCRADLVGDKHYSVLLCTAEGWAVCALSASWRRGENPLVLRCHEHGPATATATATATTAYALPV